MSEVIDLVTPPKPSARRSTLPSHAAAAEITFFDLTAAKSISPVSAQGITNDDRESASCPPLTAATSGQKILQWVCDVCKDKRFLDYREACEHKESCGKVGNARDGGGGLPPLLPPLSSSASSTSTMVASRVVAANASTTEDSRSSPKRKKSRPLEPRTPPSLGGFTDACVDAILAGTTKSDVCPQLQLKESESYPPALNATVPTSSPTVNAATLGSCQVCPTGINSPVATGQKILQQRWVCDVCKVKWFLDFREACEHEESCGKVANERTGGGGLPPPPEPMPPSSSSASSTSTTVSSRESSCVAAKNAATSEESKEDNNEYMS